jgi:hypothetical protein
MERKKRTIADELRGDDSGETIHTHKRDLEIPEKQ